MINKFLLQNEGFNLEQFDEATARVCSSNRYFNGRRTSCDAQLGGQNIFRNLKNDTISQNVSETILTLRWYLVGKIIDELKSSILPDVDNTGPMTQIKTIMNSLVPSQVRSSYVSF
jgi:DNA primase